MDLLSCQEGKIVGLAVDGNRDVLRDVVLERFRQAPGNFRIVEINNTVQLQHC